MKSQQPFQGEIDQVLVEYTGLTCELFEVLRDIHSRPDRNKCSLAMDYFVDPPGRHVDIFGEAVLSHL